MGFETEGWTRRARAVVQASAIGAGGLVGECFPFFHQMVSAEVLADILTHARSDMGDLRWSLDSAGKSELTQDQWFGSNAGSAAKFSGMLNGSFSATVNTPVYLFYGKPDATRPTNTGVYPAAVDIVLPNGGVDTNRASGVSLGTAIGGLSSGGISSGPLDHPGSATDYNGSSQGLNLGTTPVSGNTARTLIVWIKPDLLIDDREIFRISDIGSGEAWVFRSAGSASGRLRLAVTSGSVTSTLTPLTSGWNMVAIRHGTTTLASAEFFLNGTLQNASSSSVAINTSAGVLYQGTNQGTGNWFNGQMAIAQVRSEEVSTAVLETQWNAINDPGSVMVWDAPEGLGGSPSSVRARGRWNRRTAA